MRECCDDVSLPCLRRDMKTFWPRKSVLLFKKMCRNVSSGAGGARERYISTIVVYIESWVFFWDGIPVGGEEISDLFFKKKKFHLCCLSYVLFPNHQKISSITAEPIITSTPHVVYMCYLLSSFNW